MSAHKCLICNHGTEYFFSKDYPSYPGSPFAETLKVDFWKCGHCGFTVSKTHQEMTEAQWSLLNSSWHHIFENDFSSRTTNQPPYIDQALALKLLAKNDVIDFDSAIDYAAGYGTFSRCMKKYFDIEILLHASRKSILILKFQFLTATYTIWTTVSLMLQRKICRAIS